MAGDYESIVGFDSSAAVDGIAKLQAALEKQGLALDKVASLFISYNEAGRATDIVTQGLTKSGAGSRIEQQSCLDLLHSTLRRRRILNHPDELWHR